MDSVLCPIMYISSFIHSVVTTFLIMKCSKVVSLKINKLSGKEGKLWQRSFYDECITDSVKLIQKLEYIHNNPVKENLVNSPEEYPFKL